MQPSWFRRTTRIAGEGIVVFAGSQGNVVADNRLGPASGAPAGSPVAGVSASIFPDTTTASGTAERPLVAIDCLDATVGEGTAGTANQWQRNSGLTAIPTGLRGQS